MVAEDPAVIERKMYVDMHLGGVDNPSLSLAQLRYMGGGGVNAWRAALAGTVDDESGGGGSGTGEPPGPHLHPEYELLTDRTGWVAVDAPTTNERPVAYRVLWVGGDTQPVNMAIGDLWVKDGSIDSIAGPPGADGAPGEDGEPGPPGPPGATPDVDYTFTFSDDRATLTAGTGTLKLANPLQRNLTIKNVQCTLGTAPTGSSLIVDVRTVSSGTIFTNPAHRPTFTVSSTQCNSVLIDAPAWNDGAQLVVDIAQIGSSTAGGYLTVTIVAED